VYKRQTLSRWFELDPPRSRSFQGVGGAKREDVDHADVLRG